MDSNETTERRAACNSTYKKLAVQCSGDTFVVNQSLVLRINICGGNRQLLVAANRWAKSASLLLPIGLPLRGSPLVAMLEPNPFEL